MKKWTKILLIELGGLLVVISLCYGLKQCENQRASDVRSIVEEVGVRERTTASTPPQEEV